MNLEQQIENFVQVIENHNTPDTFAQLYEIMYQDILGNYEIDHVSLKQKVLQEQIDYTQRVLQ